MKTIILFGVGASCLAGCGGGASDGNDTERAGDTQPIAAVQQALAVSPKIWIGPVSEESERRCCSPIVSLPPAGIHPALREVAAPWVTELGALVQS
jgi:hypothetical protein